MTKLNAAGSALVYSTLLGGSDNDSVVSIAVDGAANAYVTGYTWSTDFPTVRAMQNVCGCINLYGPASDAFVAKITP